MKLLIPATATQMNYANVITKGDDEKYRVLQQPAAFSSTVFTTEGRDELRNSAIDERPMTVHAVSSNAIVYIR